MNTIHFSTSSRFRSSRGLAASLGKQRGAVLLIALIFLLLLTILAVFASTSSMLQLRMAGNLRNAQQADMSANTALRGAEWKLWNSASAIGSHIVCTDGSISSEGCVVYNAATDATYGVAGSVTKFKQDAGWLGNIGLAYKGPTQAGYKSYSDADMKTAALADNPRYIIEDMGRVVPPGTGPQHESGDTGPNNGGAGHLNVHIYRITARATGGSANSVSIMQSTFDAQTSN